MNLLPAAATNDRNPGEGVMNNSSLFTADPTTHLKIVVLALVCATLVAGIGVASRITDTEIGRLEATSPVMQAGTPMTAATRDPIFFR
jgi:hypothetical protein